MAQMYCGQDFVAAVGKTPRASSSTTPTYNMAAEKVNDSTQLGLKAHSQDPILFVDTELERTVRDFFGVTPFTSNNTPHYQPRDWSDCTYYDSRDTMISYNPATDDLKEFKKRAEELDAVNDHEVLGESMRGFRRDVGLFNRD